MPEGYLLTAAMVKALPPFAIIWGIFPFPALMPPMVIFSLVGFAGKTLIDAAGFPIAIITGIFLPLLIIKSGAEYLPEGFAARI
jgi:hypothetical protein